MFKVITWRSPSGGAPLREWALTERKGKSNIEIEAGGRVVTRDSLYCIQIGYLPDGSRVLLKDADAHRLFKLLRKEFRG